MMTGSRSDPTGRDYLLKRSRLAKRLGEMATFDRIQIVDDDQFDADVLAGNLRKILGREIEVAEVEDRIERNFRSVFEYGSDTAAPAENIAAAAACDL